MQKIPPPYMSGYTDDTVVRHGILEAKAEFLQKPFSPRDLLRRIRQVLDQDPDFDRSTPDGLT
jgi:DNA-binding response OmpR family regulator